MSTMNSLDTNETQSMWTGIEMPNFSALTDNVEVDVCVVGGGIAGITTAYLLMKQGQRVCVLDAFGIGSGQTGRTTAQFTTYPDEGYANIRRLHGEEGAKIVAESRRAVIRKVEQIIQAENISCDFEKVNGFLFSEAENPREKLEKELQAAKEAGLLDVELLKSSPHKTFESGPVLRFSDQAQLHPTKYISALAQKIVEGGGLIFTGTPVVEFHSANPTFVKTEQGDRVICKSIVVATNSPVNDIFAIHTKQAPYRSYVLGLQVPKGSVPKGLYWDDLDPYHYVRIESHESGTYDILVVGGEDHKTGQDDHPEQRFDSLLAWAKQRFPMIEGILYSWSGQVMEPVDGIAYLGHNPWDRKNVYVITGDSGDGMIHGTLGGMIVTDQIMGQPNRWEQLYSPSRITLRATTDFLKENANVAAQYGDWLSVKTKPHIEDMPFNEGVVFRDGVKMVAAYRNEWGKVEFMSAACTHLAGVVAWNSVEKSWDCPCHGSRFDCHGSVIEGPAVEALAKLEDYSEKLQEAEAPGQVSSSFIVSSDQVIVPS